MQELVPARHRAQDRAQLQVLDQVAAAAWQVGGDVEILVGVQQVGLHVSRPFSCS